MTGISDIVRNSRVVVSSSKALFLRVLNLFLPSRLMIASGECSTMCPQPVRPDPRPSVSQTRVPKAQAAARMGLGQPCSWALLLPITSRGSTLEQCWRRLERVADGLRNSIPDNRYHSTTIRVAVDMKDPVYDSHESEARIRVLLQDLKVEFCYLPPMYQGALCWIWAKLAKEAVDSGDDFIVLLGDDVLVLDDNWQTEVEQIFRRIENRTGAPFGFGCVAIRDLAFPVFPTFPVVHALHIEIMGSLFPPEFKNQHGDPWLFELYRRWGASQFTERAKLRNETGGMEPARYTKASDFVWRDDILTRGINQLHGHLSCVAPHVQSIPALDIVVPTYRCDMRALEAICALETIRKASVSTLVVVDNPDHPAVERVMELKSYAANRVVRVYVMKENMGASQARNTGLAQSFGDHAVLLDDDVQPDPHLLDAYLGAIDRHPTATIFVGLTSLPTPVTVMQHAMSACRICYFYGISQTDRSPPWGVTANLCVKSRTNNDIWFSGRYPKTGGGEDVEFCIRLKRGSDKNVIAVAEAKVTHPWWLKPLVQVRGWAQGDVLCLEALPHLTFYTLPNWCETVLLVLLCTCLGKISCQDTAWLSLLVVAMEIAFLVATHLRNVPRSTGSARLFVALLSSFPPMLQDITRLEAKLWRFRLTQLCMHFDWMDGQHEHIAATQSCVGIKFVSFGLAIAAAHGSVTSLTLLVCLFTSFAVMQHPVFQTARPLCSHRPLNLPCSTTVPFVVVATQRTGSNMLCGNLLHSHPDVEMHNELFNPNGINSHCGGVNTSIEDRDTDPERFLFDAYDIKQGVKAVGFKLQPDHIRRSQVHHELFARLLKDPQVRKIVLRRENRLAVCTSELKSAINGSYTQDNLDCVRVKITPSDLQCFNESYDAYYDWLDTQLCGQTVLRIVYEDLVEDQEKVMQQVCKFLSLDSAKYKYKELFRKQNQLPLYMSIENFDELRRSFAYTTRATDFKFTPVLPVDMIGHLAAFILPATRHALVVSTAWNKVLQNDSCYARSLAEQVLRQSYGYGDVELAKSQQMLADACWTRRTDTEDEVKALVRFGVDVNALVLPAYSDKQWCTPLLFAIESGHRGIVQELIRAQASVNLESSSWYFDSVTPLYASVQSKNIELVEDLIAAGAALNTRIRTEPAQGDTPEIFGMTALSSVAKSGQIEVIDRLLKASADVNQAVMFQNTPLHFACSQGHLEVVKLLIAGDASLDVKNFCGSTPLDSAAEGLGGLSENKGRPDIVRLLMGADADTQQMQSWRQGILAPDELEMTPGEYDRLMTDRMLMDWEDADAKWLRDYMNGRSFCVRGKPLKIPKGRFN